MGHQPPFRIVHEQALATLVECRFQPANFGIEKSRPSHSLAALAVWESMKKRDWKNTSKSQRWARQVPLDFLESFVLQNLSDILSV